MLSSMHAEAVGIVNPAFVVVVVVVVLVSLTL